MLVLGVGPVRCRASPSQLHVQAHISQGWEVSGGGGGGIELWAAERSRRRVTDTPESRDKPKNTVVGRGHVAVLCGQCARSCPHRAGLHHARDSGHLLLLPRLSSENNES